MQKRITKVYNDNKAIIDEAVKSCKIVTNGNLDVYIQEHNNHFSFVLQSVKGCISVRSVWDDDNVFDKIKELENDITLSVACGYGIPKPTTKPMFSVDEIYTAIASENN